MDDKIKPVAQVERFGTDEFALAIQPIGEMPPEDEYLYSQATINSLVAEIKQLQEALTAAGANVTPSDGWRTIEDTPPHNRRENSLGTQYLIHPVPENGEPVAFFGRRLGGPACWYRYGARVHGITHWRPIPGMPGR